MKFPKDLISVYKSSAPAFPTGVMASNWSLSLKEVIGSDVQYKEAILGLIRDDQCEWYLSEGDIEQVARAVLSSLSINPNLVKKARSEFLKASRELLLLISPEIIEKKISKLTNPEILEIFEKGIELYRKATYWPEPANFSLELRGQEIAKSYLIEFIDKNKIHISQSEANDIFSTLSNPIERSFVANAELSLLKIVHTKNLAEKEKAIHNHAKKYYWQIYDYYGPILDKTKIKKELKDYESLPEEEIKNRISKIENYEQTARAKLDRILNLLNLSSELQNIFCGLREFAYLYGDIKKERISRANVGWGIILKEISKRFKINETDLHFAAPAELIKLLKTGKTNSEVLSKRRKKSCLKIENKTYYFLNDDDVRNLEEIISKQIKKTKLIRGLAASSGKYIGIARIIESASAVTELKEGEILITKMTTIDFVPAMKKAGAIVTDLGAITSHAAIVSRELGTPCIVGTKNATQIIKTGDMIEVNANHGIIKIL